MSKTKYKEGLREFVVKNKTACYNAFKQGINHRDYKTPEGKDLIEKARTALNYSWRTWSGDIYRTIWVQYKSIVIDGGE